MAKNVETSVSGSILTVRIDLAKSHGTSASGKSEIIGTTEGNMEVPSFPGVKLGVNCYKPAPAKPASK